MSKYLQSLASHLHDKELLSDTLKVILLEHDAAFYSKPSIKLNFGKYKGKTIAEVAEFDRKYLSWLTKQQWCFNDVKEEINNNY